MQSGMKLDEGRQALRDQSDCRFIGRVKYCQQLASTKRMQRCDEKRLAVRGLLDLETGTRFMIEEEKLYVEDATNT